MRKCYSAGRMHSAFEQRGVSQRERNEAQLLRRGDVSLISKAPSFRINPEHIQPFSKAPKTDRASVRAGQAPEDLAVTTIESKEASPSLSLKEAQMEVAARLRSLYDNAAQQIFSRVAEDGRDELVRVLSASMNHLAPRVKCVAEAALERLKKAELTGASKESSDLQRVVKEAADAFQPQFEDQFVPFFFDPRIANPSILLDELLLVGCGKKTLESSTLKRYNDLLRQRIEHRGQGASNKTPLTNGKSEEQIVADKLIPTSIEPPAIIETANHLVRPKPIERETPQSWLDLEREKAFERLHELFKGLIEGPTGIDGFRLWFLDCFNPAIEAAGRAPLTLTDLQSISVIDASSASATAVAGKEITRPIIVFHKLAELHRFLSALTGAEVQGTGGFVLAASDFIDDGLLSKTGLIFSWAIDGCLSHELRHTVDPYVHEREDDIVDEAFAYFSQLFPTQESLNDTSAWSEYLNSIIRSCVGNDHKKEHDTEAMKTRATQFVGAFQAYTKGKNILEVQRFLVQCRTIEEAEIKMRLAR